MHVQRLLVFGRSFPLLRKVPFTTREKLPIHRRNHLIPANALSYINHAPSGTGSFSGASAQSSESHIYCTTASSAASQTYLPAPTLLSHASLFTCRHCEHICFVLFFYNHALQIHKVVIIANNDREVCFDTALRNQRSHT